jgi:hypothetical protein
MEQAQPDPVVSVILEDLEAGLAGIVVFKNGPAVFGLLQE